MTDFIVNTRSPATTISLEEVRAHLNLFDDNSFDTMLTLMLDAAQQNVEDYIGEFISQTDITQPFYGFYGHLPLVHEKINTITSVTYKANNGTTKTVASSVYLYDDTSNRKVITLRNGQAWPSDVDTTNYRYPVSVNYVAEWSSLPMAITQAVLMTVSEMFDHRSDSTPQNLKGVPVSVQYLLRPYVRV